MSHEIVPESLRRFQRRRMHNFFQSKMRKITRGKRLITPHRKTLKSTVDCVKNKRFDRKFS